MVVPNVNQRKSMAFSTALFNFALLSIHVALYCKNVKPQGNSLKRDLILEAFAGLHT